MSFFNKFENKYIIQGILCAEASIHIGTRTLDFSPTAVDNSVIRDENNNPFIPGSSIKGVLRSFMERIIPSLYNKDEIISCDIVSNSCVTNGFIKDIKNNKNLDDLQKAQKIYDKECDVCKLFGGKSFASKITISDSRLIGNRAYTQIRDGVSIDRDTLTASNKKKYNFETVEAGTTFSFEMVIDNLEEKHKDLIRILLNYLESGQMKVGGKTSYGLGTVKLIDKKIYKIDKSNVRQFYINGMSDNIDKFKGDL